jgi:signal transduction histidine kinase
MNKGGENVADNGKSTAIQVVMVVLPLLFALWAAIITNDYVPPLAFAFSWAVICIVHLTYFAHVRRTDLSSITRDHAAATLQHDRITAIINNLADAIIATDEQGIVQLSNSAALNLLDTNTNPINSSVDDIMRLVAEDHKRVHLSKLLSSATTTVNREDISLKIGDELIHLSLIYTPIRGTDSLGEKAQKGYIIIMRDITRQKSLEEERDEFIGVVSHELRTPITIAEGALSNLQLMNDRGQATSAQLTAGIGMAHDQITFLAGMINDLSTLSRAERGVMSEQETINIEPFIHGIYKQYEKEARKKDLRLNLDLDPQLGAITVSELYLRELIQNLITNAIKYTKKGSVTLAVHKNKEGLTFAVKDTGIGISKSDQKHIFEKFFRSEDYRTRETNGTGLGLYVAKKLSHLLGTQIQLESRLNHGSTFSFELPQSKR